MSRSNIAAVSALLALAAVLGTIAATHTVSLGAAKRQAAVTTLQAQSRSLDRFEASLRKALARRPPALPALPRRTAASPRVVYRRPAPVVVVRHLHHGDDGESSAEGGTDD
jgi:hypothetical protein